MPQTVARVRLISASILLFCLILVPSAWASSASISLSRSVGPPTSRISVSGSGFGSSESVDVRFGATLLGTATTDAVGTFSAKIRIPASAIPGAHTVRARGEISGAVAQATFLVRTDWLQYQFD